MKNLNLHSFVFITSCTLGIATPVAAQTHSTVANAHSEHHAMPYAGQQNRNIKAMSDSEVKAYINGDGMGHAKAAELNGYPGPQHTLELAKELNLTTQQKNASTDLLNAHKSEVKQLGAQLIKVEEHLNQRFSTKNIDAKSIEQMTQHIAQLQASIRSAHLKTHLLQTQLLTANQVANYQQLRGYAK